MFNKSLVGTMKNVLSNLVKLLSIAWNTDRFLTFGYYASAGISAFFPIIKRDTRTNMCRLAQDGIIVANSGRSKTLLSDARLGYCS